MHRRTFLIGMASTALRPWSAFGSIGMAQNSVVEISSGKIQGIQVGSIRRFLGVPIGKAPAGALRFRAPRPAEPWSGVLETVHPPKAPYQGGRVEAQMSEDCLAVNIWAPAEPGKYPVFVWIHGGGNSGGSIHDDALAGPEFAQDGIVCVTLAYRVGALGFLDLSSILGDDYAGSGNNAIRDLLNGLRWVRENIHAFGGDPNCVTIAGESAGAKDVAALMGTPEAKGLFHRAISESGSGQTTHTPKSAAQVARLFVKHAGLTSATASQLLTMSPMEIIHAQEKMTAAYPANYPFRPVVDRILLPERPVDSVQTGMTAHVPLLIGTNRDEYIAFTNREAAKGPIRSRQVANADLRSVKQVAEKYAMQFPDLDPFEIRLRLLTAEEYWVPTIRLADAQANTGAPVFMYRFDHENQNPQDPHFKHAAHGAEVGYVWGYMPATASAEAKAVSKVMRRHWAKFIKSGDAGWPAYDSKHRKTLQIGNGGHTSVLMNPRADELALWDGVL